MGAFSLVDIIRLGNDKIVAIQDAATNTFIELNDDLTVSHAYSKDVAPVSTWMIYRAECVPEAILYPGTTVPTGDTTVLSVAVMPGDGEDEVWLAVGRYINNQAVTCIERFTPFGDAFYADSSVTYSGVSTSSPGGFSHLEGLTVGVLADGIDIGTKVVTGGVITLSTAAAEVTAGIPFTGTLKPMRIDISTKAGVTHGSLKNTPKVVLSLLDTPVLKYGLSGSLFTATFAAETGDLVLSNTTGWTITDPFIITTTGLLGCTVRAIIATVEVGGIGA